MPRGLVVDLVVLNQFSLAISRNPESSLSARGRFLFELLVASGKQGVAFVVEVRDGFTPLVVTRPVLAYLHYTS
jgi:hypothetical protein